MFSTAFRKILKYQFPKNPPSESRIVSCGRTDGQTNMTKLVVAFRSFANATKKWQKMALTVFCCWLEQKKRRNLKVVFYQSLKWRIREGKKGDENVW